MVKELIKSLILWALEDHLKVWKMLYKDENGNVTLLGRPMLDQYEYPHDNFTIAMAEVGVITENTLPSQVRLVKVRRIFVDSQIRIALYEAVVKK